MDEHLLVFLERQADFKFPRSQEFAVGDLVVYLRAGPYHLDAETRKREKAVGIARVDLLPQHQGKGIFRNFIVALETRAKQLGYVFMRVEQVHNEKLAADLAKHGYVPHIVFEDVLCKEL